MRCRLTDGFTLVELLVVIALLLLLGGLAMPRVGGSLVEYRLISEARFAHAHAQAVRQYAIMRSRDTRIEYLNTAPARIWVRDHQSGAILPEFAERILPEGFALWPVGQTSKMVIYNSRGEASWIPSVSPPNRIIIRAPNGQERHLLFHRAGRIMLQKPQ